MKNPRTAVLLINLGTPDSPKAKDVYRYLIEFLTDPRVIDMPFFKRHLLVRGIIVPKRYKASAKSYEKVWTKEGSPLLVYGKKVCEDLQSSLGSSFHVELGMRYQSPSIKTALKNIFLQKIDHLIILPLFPQYASATTGSVYQKVMEELKELNTFPKLTFIDSFYDHPLFIESIAKRALQFDLKQYDHFIFSFHGLPVRHLTKADTLGHCKKDDSCCQSICKENKSCYSAQCYASYLSIIKYLNIPKEKTTLTFQSRLGKDPWIEPFTSNVIEKLAEDNKKNVLVFSPSFVCDCLETTYEISLEYGEEFKKRGGNRLDLVPGLNDEPSWIETLKSLVLSNQ